jgi:hypothetical protein
MNNLRHLRFAGLLISLLPLSALSGIGTWTGTGPMATGLGNQVINALAVSPDGQTVYAGTGSGTVFNYVYADSVPTAFSFTDQTGVPLSSLRVSATAITVAGINTAADISITGGEYEINGSGTWVSSIGSVVLGNTVKVRHTASSSNSTTVNTVLTIGTVSGTFSSTTVGVPANGVCASVAGPLSSAPSTGLCIAGTASAVATGVSAYTWTCQGLNGGTPSGQCSVPRGYVVTPSAGSNGSISPNTAQVVTYNSTQLFTVNASAGYTASVAGSCGGNLMGSSYLTSAITANCTVAASFAAPNTLACTLTASPSDPIRPRQSSTLTASCNLAGASYSWTGVGCAGSTSASCTVTPAATTTYSVTGTKGLLSSTVSATVTVKAVDLTPILMLLLD